MKENPSYEPNGTFLLPELGERTCELPCPEPEQGKPCTLTGYAAVLAIKKSLLAREQRAGHYIKMRTLCFINIMLSLKLFSCV